MCSMNYPPSSTFFAPPAHTDDEVCVPSAAYFARLARDHAYATETHDMGEQGTLLLLPGGVKLHLPALLWAQYQEYVDKDRAKRV
jgi:hypothetical protein